MLPVCKKPYLGLIAVLLVLVASCSKVEPEAVKTSNDDKNTSGDIQKIEKKDSWDMKSYASSEVCGEKTCALQEYLEQLGKDGKVNLTKTKYFQDRFGILVTRFQEKDMLVKTPEFQQFVKDFYTEYFPCEWKVEVCNKTSAYSYDEQNYIWYIFLPQMVAIEFQSKKGGNDSDTESIIQAIRRTYYASYDEKEAMEQVWRDKLTEKVDKIDLSVIDKKKVQEDKAYFEEIILTPKTGLYDQIFDSVMNPIPWEEKGQRLYSRDFLADLFFSKIQELGISKNLFFERIGTSEQNFKKLDDKLEAMDKTYGMSGKIPNDRYLRHDEIANYVFTNLRDFDAKGDFNTDVLEVRHYVLLQFSYGDDGLYEMPDRAARSNSKHNFMGENLVKYSKYMNNVVKY